MSKLHMKVALTLFLSMSFFFKMGAQAALILLFFGNKLARPDLHLSLDAGLNFSNISQVDGDMRIGPNFGLGLHVGLTDQLFLVPEFKALSTRGLKSVKNPVFDLPADIQNLSVASVESFVRLNYLDFPVLLQYRTKKHFYFSGGIEACFLNKANYQTDIVLDNGNELELRQDVKSKLKKFDLGIPIEVGYVIFPAVDGKGMDVRLRYTFGLFDVLDGATSSPAKNSNFQLIATFPIVYPEDKEKKK
ncbi:porin family protein [Owenweeksia hongkongensis]|nr:porin family protein [Owenweeksia hongkongensis]